MQPGSVRVFCVQARLVCLPHMIDETEGWSVHDGDRIDLDH
jgi:hypothetical protein